MSVLFQKNIFYSNEIAYAFITIKNSKSELDIENIEFQII